MLDDLLMRRGLIGANDFDSLRKHALDEAMRQFPGGGNDDHADAFRHAYWNAMMAAAYGEKWAERFGTAHEGDPRNDSPAREAMDLYNNEVGRRIARENPTADPDQLADLIADAVRNGQMVVIDHNGNLGWSNGVPLGQTGDPKPGERPGNPDWDDVAKGAPS